MAVETAVDVWAGDVWLLDGGVVGGVGDVRKTEIMP